MSHTRTPWEAKHFPEGSIIQPVGSTRSILRRHAGTSTPHLLPADAELIVAAVNAFGGAPSERAAPDRSIAGYCPMGCGETLFVGAGGHITCSLVTCPSPCAVEGLIRRGLARPKGYYDIHLTSAGLELLAELNKRAAEREAGV